MKSNPEHHFDNIPLPSTKNTMSAGAYISCWQNHLKKVCAALPAAIVNQTADAYGYTSSGAHMALQALFNGIADPVQLPHFPKLDRKCAVLAAGNIPGVALAPAILAAAAGCKVLVKAARIENFLLPWLIKTIEAENQGFQSGIRAHIFPEDKVSLHTMLTVADAIIAFGSDQTMQLLAQKYGAKHIAYGHKFSVSFADTATAETVAQKNIASDAALFNQQGCLSTHAVFLQGSRDEAVQWGRKFASIFDKACAALSGCRNSGHMRIHALEEQCMMSDIVHWRGPNSGCLVVLDDEFRSERLIGSGVVQIIPVASIESCARQLRPLSGQLQGVSVAVVETEFPRIQRVFEALGVSRIARAGYLQHAHLGWRNGGVFLPDILA